MKAYLVLDTKEVFFGRWHGGISQVGEVVFNTSHSGYEEIATDPSYCNQIIVMTSSMQGNYGCDKNFWESKDIHIKAFICLEVQQTKRESSWVKMLSAQGIPVVSELDTRKLVLRLRSGGTPWGAIVQSETKESAQKLGLEMIQAKKSEIKKQNAYDWPSLVSTKKFYSISGSNESGPKVAILDFGVKQNIIRELQKRCSEVGVFPCASTREDLEVWSPDGILLSNGPGDPSLVEGAPERVNKLVGWKPIMGICMGHQILCIALGGKTYKLTFGHRGANHPIKDKILDRIYMTSQNHGYAVDAESLSSDIEISHINLNDNTVAGISYLKKKCFSVQFHPESHPGPREAESLFDHFIGMLL